MDLQDMTDEEHAALAAHLEHLQTTLRRSRWRYGAPAAMAALAGLTSWVLALATDDLGFDGFLSGVILLGLAAAPGFLYWRDLQQLRRVKIDLEERRKQLIKGTIRAKERHHNPGGVTHSINVGDQRYPINADQFERVRFNDRVRLHLAVKSRYLFHIDRLRKNGDPSCADP